jgi:hypothetical protein
VNFKNLREKGTASKPTDPLEVFQSLVKDDRFEHLRGVQTEALTTWDHRRTEQDTVLKMTTGAGKTLVGLLMLQSSLNEGVGPSLYLCPNNHLVDQVVEQARQYGISTTQFEPGGSFPVPFLNSEAILVTSFQKAFNGKSVFGVKGSGRSAINVGTLLIDDAHSCLSVAKDQVTVQFERKHAVFGVLLELFGSQLHAESPGTAADIRQGDPLASLAVPYWAWQNAHETVTSLLAKHKEDPALQFTWPLIRDELKLCTCIFTGSAVEISPRLVPIERLPTIATATRRLFLSATLVDDAVLIRDFSVSDEAVKHAVIPKHSGAFGERLLLCPALIDPSLADAVLKDWVLTQVTAKHNVVILVPSGKAAVPWQNKGAATADSGTISEAIRKLTTSVGNFVVLANRYDGIDLPNEACRILIVDGLPAAASLYDRYEASSRPGSKHLLIQQAQKIEQGLGRGIRSGSDYCVCLLTGNELVRFISWKLNHVFFSPEMKRQLDIGREVAEEAKGEKRPGVEQLNSIVGACLGKDGDWRHYYAGRMVGLEPQQTFPESAILARTERQSAELYRANRVGEAVEVVQRMLDSDPSLDPTDRGWYFQFAAQLLHTIDPTEAQILQQKGHSLNHHLFRPIGGVQYTKLQAPVTSQAEQVLRWVTGFDDPNAIPVAVASALSDIAFGVKASTFEAAWNNLGNMIGFQSQRPEQETGRGPDLLWALSDGVFLVQEAKNDVLLSRPNISKSEVGQLSTSMQWFAKEYPEATGVPVLIHPTSICAPDAYPPNGAKVVTPAGLASFKARLTDLAAGIARKNPDAWTSEGITYLLKAHRLTGGDLVTSLLEKVKPPK